MKRKNKENGKEEEIEIDVMKRWGYKVEKTKLKVKCKTEEKTISWIVRRINWKKRREC